MKKTVVFFVFLVFLVFSCTVDTPEIPDFPDFTDSETPVMPEEPEEEPDPFDGSWECEYDDGSALYEYMLFISHLANTFHLICTISPHGGIPSWGDSIYGEYSFDYRWITVVPYDPDEDTIMYEYEFDSIYPDRILYLQPYGTSTVYTYTKS